MPGARAPHPDRVDGRRQRSARTRSLIIEAYLALLRESPQIPTAAAITDRAGCSVRSIFERFPDLHALRVAVTEDAMTRASCQVATPPNGGDREERLSSHVEARAQVCQ